MFTSFLDQDKYKLDMAFAILMLFPGTEVVSSFINRRADDTFDDRFLAILQDELARIKTITLNNEEYKWLVERKDLHYNPMFYEWLKNYRFNPSGEVYIYIEEGQLKIIIKGLWERTIFWEIILMETISEIYFKLKGVKFDGMEYYKNTLRKKQILSINKCYFSEFGSRRRFSSEAHEIVIQALSAKTDEYENTFVGTSNMHFARMYGLKPIGTKAHEFTMGISALCGLMYANRFDLEYWQKVYPGTNSIALTDTFGTDAFFKDFTLYHAKLYDGLRHDSGSPYEFADKVVAHYEKLGIDPKRKIIVFSDGLNPDECVKIRKHVGDRIACSFGIGTNFTNDVPGNRALNMVIKLRQVNGVEVVKISDNPSKATGDQSALDIAFKTFGIK